jgi:hypothetical protein
MRLAMLTAILTIVAPAASLLPDLDAQASEWGCEDSAVRVFLRPIVARCSCLSSADESTDLRNGKLGFYLANLSRGRNRQAGLRAVCRLSRRLVGRV